jgi:serine/threonine protein kinase
MCMRTSTRFCARLDTATGQLCGSSWIFQSRRFPSCAPNCLRCMLTLWQPDSKGDKSRFLALKILSAEAYTGRDPIIKRDILKHLGDRDYSLRGFNHICHLVDDFKHRGRNGKHVCLVFELMGERLRTFRQRFQDNRLPYDAMRRLTRQLVLALDYAHGKDVMHTGTIPLSKPPLKKMPNIIRHPFRQHICKTHRHFKDRVRIPRQEPGSRARQIRKTIFAHKVSATATTLLPRARARHIQRL